MQKCDCCTSMDHDCARSCCVEQAMLVTSNPSDLAPGAFEFFDGSGFGSSVYVHEPGLILALTVNRFQAELCGPVCFAQEAEVVFSGFTVENSDAIEA